MKAFLMLGTMVLFLAACGGGAGASGDPHSSPEGIFAAYSAATDKGDLEALKRTVLPSQHEMVSGATGVDGESSYAIERRVDVSENEVHLFVRFTPPSLMGDIALPHVIVRQGEKWYVDMERTALMMYGEPVE